MQTRSPTHNILLIIIYLLLISANWTYIIWLKYQHDIIATSFFLLVPLFGYFYFTFTIISTFFIYHNVRLGFSLSCGVLMFGMILDVLAYNMVNTAGFYDEALVIVFVILNTWLMIFMGAKQTRCKQE